MCVREPLLQGLLSRKPNPMIHAKLQDIAAESYLHTLYTVPKLVSWLDQIM
jgi:hypothetical protein